MIMEKRDLNTGQRIELTRMELSVELEKLCEWRKWMEEIPAIKFPADWAIQIIPPFTGAIVRFRVKKGKGDVSIYLDCYETLGCYYPGGPYWEVYPVGDDVGRCGIKEIDKLLEMISLSLEEQENE